MSNPVPWPVRNSEQIVRINVDEYIQMPQSGALREGSPIELLDGVLVWKDCRDHEGSFMVVGIRRTNTVERLYRLLDRATEGHGGFVRSQQPVRLSDFSMPEPDVMILRGDHENSADRHPTATDVLLVAEVADNSLKQDQTDKLSKYAAAGIPEYWIVNLVDNHLESYARPVSASGTYESHTTYHAEESVHATLPDGLSVTLLVSQIL